MRTRVFLAAAAALIAAPLTVEARTHDSGRQRYFYYYTGSTPTMPTERLQKRAYDEAWVYHRVHGVWPDGKDHAGWRRGQILPLADAQSAARADWRAAGLNAPKDGYRWLRIANDYLMVGNVSRLIAAVELR